MKSLDKYVLEMVHRYLCINVGEKVFPAPYYINRIEPLFLDLMRKVEVEDEKVERVHEMYKNREIPFGWYRGKGTPEEIEESIKSILTSNKITYTELSKDNLIGYMNLFGIGVDCSGFVYNVLSFGFKKIGKFNEFELCLDWSDKEKRGVDKAGVFTFSGKASIVINKEDLATCDLAIKKDNDHIALVIGVNDKLKLAESRLPGGVSVRDIDDVDVDMNDFEFRRLKCLD
jgi:hypothetical protein